MSEITDAIRAGDAARVEELISADPRLLDLEENGATPLLLAVYHGRDDIARMLASRRPPGFGEACAIGDAARVEELLASDPALLHSRTPDGFPAFAVAIFFGHGALARRLIERGADVNAVAVNAMCVAPVHAATAAGDHETMRLLLARGADANARQQLDTAPLHDAAGRGDVEMARLLLAHGADPVARTSEGLTPLDLARRHGQEAFAVWWESLPARE